MPDEEQQADRLRYLRLGPPFWHPANFKHLSSPRLHRGIALEGGGRGGQSEDGGTDPWFIGMRQICARPQRPSTVNMRASVTMNAGFVLDPGRQSNPDLSEALPSFICRSVSHPGPPSKLSGRLVNKFLKRGFSDVRRGIGHHPWIPQDTSPSLARLVLSEVHHHLVIAFLASIKRSAKGFIGRLLTSLREIAYLMPASAETSHEPPALEKSSGLDGEDKEASVENSELAGWVLDVALRGVEQPFTAHVYEMGHIREGGEFVASERWTIKEISQSIEVPLEDLEVFRSQITEMCAATDLLSPTSISSETWLSFNTPTHPEWVSGAAISSMCVPYPTCNSANRVAASGRPERMTTGSAFNLLRSSYLLGRGDDEALILDHQGGKEAEDSDRLVDGEDDDEDLYPDSPHSTPMSGSKASMTSLAARKSAVGDATLVENTTSSPAAPLPNPTTPIPASRNRL
ncbi:hypothetical protein BKA70DRAFT_1236411 [Coprinopsis sp. MPI-PUGE-AT-0042]|nr:hypothetical protein BKA70DRAFT_1236411 [Coprinopsis sp. MPI-PUGE-AT-0042]